MSDGSDDELTYAEAGVDIEDSEAATAALVGAVSEVGDTTEYAGLVDVGDRYLALATDGVGTKLLVAVALGDYSTVGIDCIAMNVNDLVAAGVEPAAFVDYLAVDVPDEARAAELGEGLAAGAEEAGVALVGGETAVMPEVVEDFDLAGTVAGLATDDDLLAGEAQAGDVLVGFASSGIHSNGLTLAREAASRAGGFDEPFPGDDYDTVGEALLEPTRIYTYLLDALHEYDVHAAAHVTGGGWTNLERMGEYRYDVTDPLPAQDVFAFVRDAGNVGDEEMHRTFNMGTGFVVAVDPADADALIDATDGERIGEVADGDESSVEIRGLSL
ncbi:phosphoribosylformylglycinamidine cyclo-ligase [Halobacterium sp. CBA1126]|uniref:phosphoribosylformylglycinamidine cyclo-ligase n=1 Tax=Halobacterium sp. CBA1126 TaxID=2668074 RepID=UPI0012F994BB|nr:phosphoribosylformylglycinamidine cyclo-ligase [Halobacterium sp. CBA1126]MUV60941.1 phosphoribosylformylglycinamidine cyclo-ligase [Halobacterium sp. CBA1126]